MYFTVIQKKVLFKTTSKKPFKQNNENQSIYNILSFSIGMNIKVEMIK